MRTYSLSVANSGSDTHANVQVLIQLSQLSVNGVLEYPSVQSIPAGEHLRPGNGQIAIMLALLAPGASQSFPVEMSLCRPESWTGPITV
jgi:hypothetical protein